VIVESLPYAKNKRQQAHLKMFNCKVKYTRSELPYFTENQIAKLLEEAGLGKFNVKTFDFNLSAAPPFFFLNTSNLPEEHKAKAEIEYRKAVEAVKKWGEASPPALYMETFVE